MNEHSDEPQDWPLRDWSTRLRPPGRVGPIGAEAGEAEILYEEPEDEAAVQPLGEAADAAAEEAPAEQPEAAVAEPAEVPVEEEEAAVVVEEPAEAAVEE